MCIASINDNRMSMPVSQIGFSTAETMQGTRKRRHGETTSMFAFAAILGATLLEGSIASNTGRSARRRDNAFSLSGAYKSFSNSEDYLTSIDATSFDDSVSGAGYVPSPSPSSSPSTSRSSGPTSRPTRPLKTYSNDAYMFVESPTSRPSVSHSSSPSLSVSIPIKAVSFSTELSAFSVLLTLEEPPSQESYDELLVLTASFMQRHYSANIPAEYNFDSLYLSMTDGGPGGGGERKLAKNKMETSFTGYAFFDSLPLPPVKVMDAMRYDAFEGESLMAFRDGLRRSDDASLASVGRVSLVKTDGDEAAPSVGAAGRISDPPGGGSWKVALLGIALVVSLTVISSLVVIRFFRNRGVKDDATPDTVDLKSASLCNNDCQSSIYDTESQILDLQHFSDAQTASHHITTPVDPLNITIATPAAAKEDIHNLGFPPLKRIDKSFKFVADIQSSTVTPKLLSQSAKIPPSERPIKTGETLNPSTSQYQSARSYNLSTNPRNPNSHRTHNNREEIGKHELECERENRIPTGPVLAINTDDAGREAMSGITWVDGPLHDVDRGFASFFNCGDGTDRGKNASRTTGGRHEIDEPTGVGRDERQMVNEVTCLSLPCMELRLVSGSHRG